MNTLTTKQHSIYGKLCDKYNNGNYQRLCSFQAFMQSELNKAIKAQKDEQSANLIAVIRYAENDF